MRGVMLEFSDRGPGVSGAVHRMIRLGSNKVAIPVTYRVVTYLIDSMDYIE